MDFGSWDKTIHEDSEQLRRIARAKNADVTPASVDHENKSALFKGSGKIPYEVTLDACTCGDFKSRKLPCKHVYRLALELEGVGVQYGVNKNDFMDSIFALPPPVQEVLYSLINEFKDVGRVSTVCVRSENHNALLYAGLVIETVVNAEYLYALDWHSLKRLLLPFDICADVLSAKVNKKRVFVCDWISENEAVILPMIQNHFIVLEFTEQLDNLKKPLYSRFRKKFIRTQEPTEYFNEDMERVLDYTETRTVYKEFFSQEL